MNLCSCSVSRLIGSVTALQAAELLSVQSIKLFMSPQPRTLYDQPAPIKTEESPPVAARTQRKWILLRNKRPWTSATCLSYISDMTLSFLKPKLTLSCNRNKITFLPPVSPSRLRYVCYLSEGVCSTDLQDDQQLRCRRSDLRASVFRRSELQQNSSGLIKMLFNFLNVCAAAEAQTSE